VLADSTAWGFNSSQGEEAVPSEQVGRLPTYDAEALQDAALGPRLTFSPLANAGAVLLPAGICHSGGGFRGCVRERGRIG